MQHFSSVLRLFFPSSIADSWQENLPGQQNLTTSRQKPIFLCPRPTNQANSYSNKANGVRLWRWSAQYKICFPLLYTILINLSPSSSKLGQPSCRATSLCICVSGSDQEINWQKSLSSFLFRSVIQALAIHRTQQQRKKKTQQIK